MSKKYLVTQDQTVDGMSLEDDAVIHYTTCSTAAATAAKTAALSGFKLVAGAFVIVKFSVTNTAASPTLNVNNTGAKTIRYKNAPITAGYLAANKIYFFVYDGTYWQLVGDVDTNTTYSEATTTAAGLISAADKTKLTNTISITSIVQGSVSSLGSYSTGFYAANVSRATKALVELWLPLTSNALGTGSIIVLYGSRYITGISSNMTAVELANVFAGSNATMMVGTDATGRIQISGSAADKCNYRITWYL